MESFAVNTVQEEKFVEISRNNKKFHFSLKFQVKTVKNVGVEISPLVTVLPPKLPELLLKDLLFFIMLFVLATYRQEKMIGLIKVIDTCEVTGRDLPILLWVT